MNRDRRIGIRWKSATYSECGQTFGDGRCQRPVRIGKEGGLPLTASLALLRLTVIHKEENKSLIYDLYGFPTHYHKQTYPNRGSNRIAEQVISLLRSHGIFKSVRNGQVIKLWNLGSVQSRVWFQENPLQKSIVEGPPVEFSSIFRIKSIRQRYRELSSQTRLNPLLPSRPKHHDCRRRMTAWELPYQSSPPAPATTFIH